MFDRYVVAQTKVSWKRRALMIASIALHGIAGIVLLVWSFFHVEEIAPPTLSLTFFSAPPPPPPPPPPAAKKRSTEVKKPVEHKMVQPTEVPKIVQPKQEEEKKEEKDDGEEGGVEGGEKGGVQGGVVGGVKGGVVGGTGTGGGKGPPPKTVAGFTLIKDQLTHPSPHLPDAVYQRFRGSSVSGTYKVCLAQSGRVDSVTPITSILGADEQVMSEIRSSWTYKPQPVPVCFVAVVKFDVR